jgi:peptidoglycan/xylan/chitin deacetylase (PgdA/CDA1 family)
LDIGPAALYPAKALVTRLRSAVWQVRAGRAEDEPGVRILFYHRVSEAPDELAVRPADFRRQVEELARGGWRAVDVAQVAERLRAGADGDRVVGLSFDDAYLDIAEHAAPLLREHGFSATVFVATGVTDGRERFSWYEQQPALMSWADICRLDGETLRFEPHTVSHPNLLALSEEEARREIAESKAELEERLGRTTKVFCYPAGLFSERERRLVAACGFEAAVSSDPGVNRPGADVLALARIQVDRRDRLLDFRAKLGGGHDRPPPLRNTWRRLRYGAAASKRS